ncbi:MAG: protein-glutamate O-methyltransferase [Syntrophobacteraceae bacterium]
MHKKAIVDVNVFSAVLSNKDFSELAGFIRAQCGIKIPPSKKQMLEGRLRKRLRALGIDSFERYLSYLFGPEGARTSEYVHLIDEVTTNKTDFFREKSHFDLLTQSVLPDLGERFDLGVRTRLNVWSAGCSTGEEPYTLAMVLSEYALAVPNFKFSVLATDISMKVLEKAVKGIYESDRAEAIPMPLRKRYLLRSKDRGGNLVRIAPELRSRVSFMRLNFLEDSFHGAQRMGVIFCRNVLIYFDRPTQEMVLRKLCGRLTDGGYLFTGHSETLHSMDLPLDQVASTVYRKRHERAAAGKGAGVSRSGFSEAGNVSSRT